MLKVVLVLAALALVRATDLSGEADASALAMDAQLAQLREEVSSLQSQNDHLLSDAKALGMDLAPAPLVSAAQTTAELDAATAEASAAELDAEIAAAVVDTSATDAEADAEAEAETGAADQAVADEVDLFAANDAAQVSDEANAEEEAAAPAPAPAPSLAEVDARQKVAQLVGEEKAVDAEMAGLEGELQSLMDESDSVLLANAQADAADEADAVGADESEADADEAEADADAADTSIAAEEADVAESLDAAFAFRQLVESSAEGEDVLASAEASLPSEDRDETPLVDAAADHEAETMALADAVEDAEAETIAEQTEADDEADDEAEDEAEDEADDEADEDAAADAEVDVDAELEMNEQAVDGADADLEAAALVETQTAESAAHSASLASLMEQEQTFRAAIEAEKAEKADLDRQIAQERYISAEAHRELAARIAEINALITQKSGELGALERSRAAKAAALAKVDAELLAKTAHAAQIKGDNAKASKLQADVVAQIQASLAAAKRAAAQKDAAVTAANAATAEQEKARLELAALRAQMKTAQRTLFRSRVSHSFGLVEPPKPKRAARPARYGMYLRDGEESGAEDSNQAFWRRVVARRTGKGFYEPYYERPARAATKKGKKQCTTGKDGKKRCRRVKKAKQQYIRPEWAPAPPKKCKKGPRGKLCRLKKKLAKLTVDLSVVPEFAPDSPLAPVEYVDRVPKRDARIAALLAAIRKAEAGLAVYGAAPTLKLARFQQVEAEDEAEDESEAEDEAEDESEEESEDESEADAEDESEDEAEDESEDESEDEAEEEADAEAEDESSEEGETTDADAMRFVQSLVQANADMQARLQAAADATAATDAATATEHEAVAETAAAAEVHADAAAAAEAEAATVAAGAVEAEAVQSLAAAKRSPGVVEADELTALDTLIAKMQNHRQKLSTRRMKAACVKGDAKCLKAAQEAGANRRKAKLAKLTNKPTIIDVRRKLLRKRLALLRQIKKQQKKLTPEFVTPSYAPAAAADFVNPEYAGEKAKTVHLGLPSGWAIPKRLNKRK